MITLIHGADSLSSFTSLKKFLDRYDELSITRLVGAAVSPQDIKEALETSSFTGKRLVVIEDITRSRSQTLIGELKNYVSSISTDQEVVVYERRLLPPESPLISLATKIQAFPGPKGASVFDWTDSVGARRLKEGLGGWNRLILSEEEDYLFLMLIRAFRMLILIKAGEFPKAPEFVLKKLTAQAGQWREDELKRAYLDLLEIDFRYKTGQQSLNLGLTDFLTTYAKLKT